MIDTLLIDCEQPESGVSEMIRRPDIGWRVRTVGMYDFDRAPLEDFRALLVSMHCDQRHLSKQRARLDAFVQGGGIIVIGGHVAQPFLTGLDTFHPIRRYRLEDLRVYRITDHPVWAGVAESDLTFRRGVAGFYGRGWHAPPKDATVIHVLGGRRLPLDFTYRLGRGHVLFHGGNDLWTYLGSESTAERMIPQLFHWISAPEGDL